MFKENPKLRTAPEQTVRLAGSGLKSAAEPQGYVATLLAITRDMQALASPNLDGDLIAACYRLALLIEKQHNLDLCRQHPRGYLAREMQQLESTIATTPARSFAGRHVKAEIALLQLEGMEGTDGSMWAVVRSALFDQISNATRDGRQ